MTSEIEAIAARWETTTEYARDLKDGTFVLAHRLMFHWMLIRGFLHDHNGYFDRWCYKDEQAAVKALTDFVEEPPVGYEPVGWHRHPPTHRRRPGGDPALEYIEA